MRPTFNRMFSVTMLIFLGALGINRYNTDQIRRSMLQKHVHEAEVKDLQTHAVEAEIAAYASAQNSSSMREHSR